MNPIALASYGMMAAARRFDAAAERVASTGEPDPASAVDLTQSKTQFKAQLAVFRIADEMQRALLDTQAARA